MVRRDDDYVDGAEFDESGDDAMEQRSDDSDEYQALPLLPSLASRPALVDKLSGAKRKTPADGGAAQVRDARGARDKQPRPMAKSAGYSWEAAYQRSWDHVHEDESGNLESAVRRMLDSNKRKRSLRDAVPVQRGIIRHFVLLLDLSADMLEHDMRPSRFDLTLQLAREFVSEYFDQNPIGQLAIVCTRDGLGERLSLMGGTTLNHGALLASRRRLEPRGEPSIQNGLEMARSCLVHLPSTNTREILFLSGSLTSVDPGNIYQTIDKLVEDRIQVSAVSLAAEVHILKELCQRTGGDFNVVLNEDHYKDLLQKHVPPRVVSEPQGHRDEYAGADLLVMGFPRRLPFSAPPSLCACHGRLVAPSASVSADGDAAGYACPRCHAKVCQVPTDCPVCGITIIMSTHLARSYHHLFPVKNFVPVNWDSVTRGADAACFACRMPFPLQEDGAAVPRVDATDHAALAPSGRYQCPRCHSDFCLECDTFVQDQLHTCPGSNMEYPPGAHNAAGAPPPTGAAPPLGNALPRAGEPQATDDGRMSRPISDILQAYTAPQRTSHESMPPSYDSDGGPASPTTHTAHSARESTHRSHDGFTAIAIGDTDDNAAPQHTVVPVHTGHPLAVSGRGPEEHRTRVRWGDDNVPVESPHHMHVQSQGGGPTITVQRPSTAAAGQPGARDAGRSGIQRPNHPGQINLGDIGTGLDQTHAAAPLGATGQTGAMELEDNDHARFLALSQELGEFDGEFDDSGAPERAAIDDAAFAPSEASVPQYEEHERARTGGFASGTTTPGATSDSSFDPVEELSHADVIEGETDGMPTRPSRFKRGNHALDTGWNKVRSLIGLGHHTPTPEDFAEKSHSGDEEGPTNMKSIPVQTSSGLRGTRARARPSASDRKAARLVRKHAFMFGGHPETSDDEDTPLRRRSTRRRAAAEDESGDEQAAEEKLDARPVPTGGVLGQLLKLYEQQRAEQEGHNSSGNDSAATSEHGTSLGGGVLVRGNKVVDSYGNQADIHDLDPTRLQTTPHESSSHRPSLQQNQYFSGRPRSSSSPSGHFTQVGNMSRRAIQGVAAEAGIDIDERPKAARSGAGAIGALIATSGNLIGAVSPNLAQLGPNPKRPGYTLDRYLMPEMNEKTLRHTAKIVADAAPVPKSMRGTHTPYSMPTPGEGSAHGDAGYNPYFANAVHGSRGSSDSPAAASRPRSRIGLNEHLSASAAKNAISQKLWHPGSVRNDGVAPEEQAKAEWQRKLKKRKARSKSRSKKQEIFITMHVAAILKRQEFLLKLARAFMMFGGPTHRLESHIQQTASALEVNCRVIYLPNLMIVSFGDETTHTSETRIIKQGSVLDLTKLTDMHTIYWNVIHDKIGVEQASRQLDALMLRKPFFGFIANVIIGGFASAFITIGSVGFGGSFVDALASFVLGSFLVFCQMTLTSEVYSNVFEIIIATLNSFMALGLSRIMDGQLFCFSAVVSGSIVLILPGFIVLTGALELQSKSIVSGSVRLIYAVIYSVLLGLGISIGTAPVWSKAPGQRFLQCEPRNEHWYTKLPQNYWAFLTVPGYSICLSVRNQCKITRKEFPVMVLIACAGWVVSNNKVWAPPTNFQEILQTQPYLVAAMGSFTVGILANTYGRVFDGRSFVVAVPGILYQLPSGLTGNVTFITGADSSGVNNQVSNGFQIGEQLLNVALGIVIGLVCSTILMYILGGRKIRGAGMFSF
ncbi:hypothetical protein MSPP1_002653 [Malassezia sp. CBS 17886]|nr:hypothetical protein MSPP1_002653 [Malassezia sp. CBS 17886]